MAEDCSIHELVSMLTKVLVKAFGTLTSKLNGDLSEGSDKAPAEIRREVSASSDNLPR
jgi:hypothetical protein